MNQTSEQPQRLSPAVDASMHDMLRMMDVASALRRGREAAEAQLDHSEQKQQLRERLLATAAAAGEQVTAAEIDAAIDEYHRRQHRYADPPAGWGRFWANAWVLRSRVLLAFALVALLVVLVWLAAGALGGSGPSAPAAVSPAAPASGPPAPAADEPWNAFDALIEASRATAADDDARRRIARIAAAGAASRANRDAAALERARRDLRQLTERLDDHYEVRIVSRPGEPSGIDRYDSDGRLSGYYVIVEAVRPDGTVLQRSIGNDETQRTERVDKWGELVDEKVWQRLVADKQADGVIDERLFAEKLPGHYDERVVLDDGSGRPISRRRQITRW